MSYDTVIVGAGPAGGQCARELTAKGKKVLLIDKAKNFLENNYSSGGAPSSILKDFKLPSSVIGSDWNTLTISSTNKKVSWHSPSSFGPILDFDKLRTFLAEEMVSGGGEFRLGCCYHSHTRSDNLITVKLKDQQTQEEFHVQTKTLVDATGSERKVLAKGPYKEKSLSVTGIEYHVQVEPAVYAAFQRSMNFFLGHHWMPQGYAWIFSMAPCRLKVGIIRYFQNELYVPHESSYQFYLKQLLTLCGPSSHVQILDKHGKTIHYRWGQKDLRQEGAILAIGDAISAINPLGCEGIRHALVSGQLAAFEIDRFLEGHVSNLNGYDRALSHYFGYKWFLSEKFMYHLFTTQRDALVDQMVHCFGLMNQQQIMDVIFDYQFRHAIRPYASYFFSRLKSIFS